MRAHRFEPLPPEKLARWELFPDFPGLGPIFPGLVGLSVEEVRTDYARMRMTYKPELRQPAGVVHGGAIATLIDTSVVPAIAWPYETVPKLLTLTMNIRYLGALVEEDAIAEAWIDTRGRSIVYCSSEVTSASGRQVADGTLVYKVPPIS